MRKKVFFFYFTKQISLVPVRRRVYVCVCVCSLLALIMYAIIRMIPVFLLLVLFCVCLLWHGLSYLYAYFLLSLINILNAKYVRYYYYSPAPCCYVIVIIINHWQARSVLCYVVLLVSICFFFCGIMFNKLTRLFCSSWILIWKQCRNWCCWRNGMSDTVQPWTDILAILINKHSDIHFYVYWFRCDEFADFLWIFACVVIFDAHSFAFVVIVRTWTQRYF